MADRSPTDPIRDPGLKGHVVTLEFDHGTILTSLAHPKTGCHPGTDPDTGEDVPGDGCWITDWLDELGTEILSGKISFPIQEEWDGDSVLLHLVAQPQPLQGDEMGELEQNALDNMGSVSNTETRKPGANQEGRQAVREHARVNLVPVLAEGLTISSSEARRLINQGAVRVDGDPVLDFDPAASFVAGKTLTVGKRRTVDIPAEPFDSSTQQGERS